MAMTKEGKQDDYASVLQNYKAEDLCKDLSAKVEEAEKQADERIKCEEEKKRRREHEKKMIQEALAKPSASPGEVCVATAAFKDARRFLEQRFHVSSKK